MSDTAAPQPGPAPAQAPARLNREQRFEAYLVKLARLREQRVTLREVMERELLLEFIQANRGNLNEFPLLEAQQQSIIHLLTQRSEHPAYEYVRRLTGDFVVSLNRFEKLRQGRDPAAAEQARIQLANNESLLIKCIQGLVYACGIITDNVEELLLRNFGARALSAYGAIMEAHQLGPDYWKAVLERFVTRPVDRAHAVILAEDRHQMTRERNFLILRLPFDAVLEQLSPPTGRVDRTRIQTAYENNAAGPEGAATLKVVATVLTRGLAFLPEDALARDEIAGVARMVCIDPATAAFRDQYLQRLRTHKAGTPETPQAARNFHFLLEQVTATGVGAVIGLLFTRQPLLSTMEGYLPESMDVLRPLLRHFSLPDLQLLLQRLLEQRLAGILRHQAAGEAGKVHVRVLRARRTPTQAVDDLATRKLNRIRRVKLFAEDPTRPDRLLFRARSPRQLMELMRALQIEPELTAAVRELWDAGDDKVEVAALIDLDQVSRTTTNVKVRLQEILAEFGIGTPRSEASEEPEPEPEAEPEDGERLRPDARRSQAEPEADLEMAADVESASEPASEPKPEPTGESGPAA